MAAEYGRVAIVISSTTSCFPVHKRVSFKLQARFIEEEENKGDNQFIITYP